MNNIIAQKENKNRYIKAMEIGEAHEDEGISYFDLVLGINNMNNKPMGEHAEKTFFEWFMDNFTLYRGKKELKSYSVYFKAYLKQKHGNEVNLNTLPHLNGLIARLDEKFFLDGQAAKQYLDYKELQQSVKSAQSARFWAIISIIVALIAIGISAYSVFASPNPPYDVKIIEDNTKVKELQNENDQLKEKLYKAEMMVKVLEDEPK